MQSLARMAVLAVAVVTLASCSENGSTQRPSRPVATPAYEVATTRDLSMGAVCRLEARVTLPQHYTRDDVERIAQAVAADITNCQDVNAISILFYGPESSTSGAYDVAMVEWAPNGRWGDAGSVRAGDYSTFRYSVSYNQPAQNADLATEQRTGQQAPEPPDSPTPEASPPEAADTAARYSLWVDPQVLPDGRVRLHVNTNIPGTIEVMAGLSLQGQADDDVWVGKNERVRLTNGQGVVTFATDDLPKGKYDAEASFYPRWGFQDATSRATGISDNLSASSSLTLVGSGESSADVQFKENSQRWVMAHVAMGDPWRPSQWVQRFGEFEEVPVDRGNPEILKAYYFPGIDTTLIVNTLKKEITVWRLGRAHH